MVGENIRKLRRDKALTQKQLADKCGISEITVRRYERGEIIPTLKTLGKIAKALDIHIKELIDENYVLNYEYDTEEKVVKSFRNLLKAVRKESIVKDLSDFDIYKVVSSEDFKDYLTYLLHKKTSISNRGGV